MMKDSGKIYTRLRQAVIPLLSLLALWTGALMYINLRSTEPVLINIINNSILSGIFSPGKSFFSNMNSPNWLLYSLPSGLWAFSYSILITAIWWKNNSWSKYLWLASSFILAIGWELLQFTGIFPGTFSFIDIFSGIIGASIGMLLAIKLIKSKNYEKKLF